MMKWWVWKWLNLRSLCKRISWARNLLSDLSEELYPILDNHLLHFIILLFFYLFFPLFKTSTSDSLTNCWITLILITFLSLHGQNLTMTLNESKHKMIHLIVNQHPHGLGHTIKHGNSLFCLMVTFLFKISKITSMFFISLHICK